MAQPFRSLTCKYTHNHAWNCTLPDNTLEAAEAFMHSGLSGL